jgi:predicted nucleic acid-binding protein
VIIYLDASALVKRYVAEAGSPEVGELVDGARVIGTGVVSRAEVAAALARAARVGALTREAAAKALESFNSDWGDIRRLQMNEPLGARAASLAWEHGLRGYDAVHLATALAWREALAGQVTVATYDRELWRAARDTGLDPWPAEAP